MFFFIKVRAQDANVGDLRKDLDLAYKEIDKIRKGKVFLQKISTRIDTLPKQFT